MTATLPVTPAPRGGGTHLRDWWRRVWRRPAAWIVEGGQLAEAPPCVPRRPLEWLLEQPQPSPGGAVVLIDHAHGQAAETLRRLQSECRAHFDAGAIVIGVENLPREHAAELASYRAIVRAPVFGVDLHQRCDHLLLAEALAASRAAARLVGR